MSATPNRILDIIANYCEDIKTELLSLRNIVLF